MKLRSRFSNYVRFLKLKLIIPILRTKHSPEHTARAVSVGFGLAMTPLVGLQISLVAFFWFLSRRLNWDFNFVIAAAWTWTTNAFTMIPCYYIFFITGKFLLGFETVPEFDGFSNNFKSLLSGLDFFESIEVIWKVYGLPMFVGCIPWAIMAAVSGYFIGYKIAFWRHNKKYKRLI